MPWARGGSAAPAAAMVMIALPVLGLLLWMSYKTIAGKINSPPPSPIVAQKVEGNIQRPLLDVPPSAALPPGSCRCSISCPVCLACLHAVGEGRLRRTRRGCWLRCLGFAHYRKTCVVLLVSRHSCRSYPPIL